MHLGGDVAEQVVVAADDDQLLAADEDSDVVGSGKLDAVERRDCPRLSGRHTRALSRRRLR